MTRRKCKERGCQTTVLVRGCRRYCKKHNTDAWVNRRANLKRKKNSKRYARHLGVRRCWATKWRKTHRRIYRERQNSCNLRLKERVLSHYGKGKKPKCCWRGCGIMNLDMLTLDHVLNNGKQHRKSGFKGGINGYRQLEQKNFPPGFQTLCANHQAKKENIRRRNG